MFYQLFSYFKRHFLIDVQQNFPLGTVFKFANMQNRYICENCCNYYLQTGYEGRARKYKPKVFRTAPACEGCVENQRLVVSSTARANS